MKSYQSIKAAIAKLEKQAEAMRVGEQRVAVARVKKLMADFGLTVADLEGATKAKLGRPAKAAKAVKAKKSAKAKPAQVGAPKFRDPKTQKTWTGRGKPPAWIAGVKNRDAYLIDAPAAPAKAAVKAKPAKKAAAKPAEKAVAKKAAAKPVKAVVKRAKKAAPVAPAAAPVPAAAAA